METNLIIYLLFIHWIADFVFQSNYVAQNKSKSNKILLWHCCLYGLSFACFTNNILYGLILSLIHFPVDYVTSRINSKLWAKGDMHSFFVSVGFDQYIHFVTIILVGNYLTLTI